MKNLHKFFKVSHIGFSALFGAQSILNKKCDCEIILGVISCKVSGHYAREQIGKVIIEKLKIFLTLDKIDDINKYG